MQLSSSDLTASTSMLARAAACSSVRRRLRRAAPKGEVATADQCSARAASNLPLHRQRGGEVEGRLAVAAVRRIGGKGVRALGLVGHQKTGGEEDEALVVLGERDSERALPGFLRERALE